MIAELDTASLFDLWAQVYDAEPNPLLLLEERALPALLPRIQDADVLDVGCGTGRWLALLEARAPRSLTGCDPSSAMLQRARTKLSSSTVLHRSASVPLPAPDASGDLVLASFVLSYIDDLPAFARECARVLRPGGTLLLTDMHPGTAAERNWTRSFAALGETVQLPAHSRPIGEIAAAFAGHRLTVAILEEVAFGEPERDIFERSNKLDAYLELIGVPAIYLLKLSKLEDAQALEKLRSWGEIDTMHTPGANAPADSVGMIAKAEASAYLEASTIATADAAGEGFSADRTAPLHLALRPSAWANSSATWSTEPLSIAEGRIASTSHTESIDLTGYVLLPGLINAHDHLEFGLFPNLGPAPNLPKYLNAPEWAEDIHRTHGALIRRHQSVPLRTRLWFGALRNLLCGVTTVCHHNPLYPELLDPEFPLRVVTDFAWAHSLNFGPDPAEALRNAQPETPFLLHVAEGIDRQSRAELYELDRLGLLDRRTVLVHGLGLITCDITYLNERGASVVLCPTSNRFLFGRIPPAHIVRQIARAALGSDSPLTAAGDLLDEIQILREQKTDPITLYQLVTSNPAEILALKEGQGSIAQGGRADLIAIRDAIPDQARSPSETLAALSLDDVELVMVGGRVQVVSPALYPRLPGNHRAGMHMLQIGATRRWVRADLPELFASAEEILGTENPHVGNKEVRHLPTD